MKTRKKNPRPATIKRRAFYLRKKLELINFLGGRCIDCGEENPELLTFDHKRGYRDWEPSEVHATKRMRIYTEEAIQGLIQLLCKHCNPAKGDSADSDVPF